MEQILNKLATLFQITTEMPMPKANHLEAEKAYLEIKTYIETLNAPKK